MDFMDIFTGGGTAALGSIFGGLFGLGKALMEQHQAYRMQKLQNEHESSMMEKEAEKAIKLGNLDMQKTLGLADQESLRTSINAEATGATWSEGWAGKLQGWFGQIVIFIISLALGIVDVVRGGIRPVMTAFLVGATFKMYLDLAARVGALNALTPDQALKIYMEIVGMILFLTGVAVGWYYGVRPATRQAR